MQRLLAAARASVGSAVAVTGDPGIGKTTLLDFAAAEASDFSVLRARGSPAETELVFAGLHELLTPVLGEFRALDTPQGRALRTALGFAAGEVPDRFLVAGGLTMLLAQLAERRPVLCLVDDIQWLDPASLDSLLFAARRISRDPVAFLLSGRDGDRRLAELAHLPLRPLDVTAARTLLIDQVGPGRDRGEGHDRVLALAGGNPLALVELGRSLAGADGDRPAPGRADRGRAIQVTLSARLQTSFLQRVNELAYPTQQLLLLLAAADTADRAWLTRAAGRHGLPMPTTLDEAESAGLVRADGTSLGFAHPLVREAIYARATAGERAEAHRSLGAASLDPERSRWHRALAAVAPDDDLADELVAAAAAAKVRGAQAAGGRALLRAADLVSSMPRSAALRLEAAEAFWEAGAPSDAESMLSAARAAAVDDPRLRVRAAHLEGRMRARTGDVLAGYEVLIAGVDLAIEVDPTRAGTMLVEAVSAASYAGDLDRVTAGGRRADALAGHLAEVPLELDVVRGIADVIEGRFERGVSLLRRVVDAARRDDQAVPPSSLAVAAAAFLGDEVAGRDLATRAVSRAREQGLLATLAQALELQAVLEIRATPAAAEIHASEGLQLAEDTGQSAFAGLHLTTLATVAAWRGDQELVRARTERVLDLAATLGLPFWHDKASAVLALLDLTLGRPREALVRLEALSADGFHRGVPIGAAVDLVEAASRSGAPERGRPVLRLLRQWTSAVRTPTASALHARAQALTGDAEPRAAFERALSFHARSVPGLESARTELLYGEFLRRERRPTEARPHLRAAVDIFERAHADPWAERARIELRASGEAPQRRADRPDVLLTPQERQIAQLAADGVPTKLIAGQLFLSPRTIDYHLRKVFTKLDITSRAQLRGRLPSD